MIEISTRFPTVIFTFLLVVCLMWWVASMLLGGLDSDLDAEAEGGFSDQLGLTSMPLPLALSLLALGGWVTSGLLSSLFSDDNDELAIAVAVGVMLAAVVVGAVVVKLASKPLGRIFHTEPAPSRTSTVGALCRIRTLDVNERRGDAEVTTGPTRGSIIQVRAAEGRFVRGAIAHVIDYDSATNTYLIDDVDDAIKPD